MKLFNQARKYGSRIAAAGTGLMLSGAVMAQTATGVDVALDSVDLTTVATKVGAAVVLVIGIAMVFKGVALGKRVISKV